MSDKLKSDSLTGYILPFYDNHNQIVMNQDALC
jgi:hypothetical protein